MKSKIIVISILAIFALFLGIRYVQYVSQRYKLDDLRTEYPINYPIDNPREAIEVLKNKNQIDFAELEKIKASVNFDIDLIFMAKKESNNWSVLITTKGVLPSYSCEYLLDINGEPVQQSYIIKGCNWNK